MANFFAKAPKAKSAIPSRSTSLTKEADPNAAGPSNIQSDYVKAFKPFTIKRDVEIAPINSFYQRQKGKKFRETQNLASGAVVIVIDDDEERGHHEDIHMQDIQSTNDLGQLTAEGRY